MMGSRAAQEVLLELTLLDADITLPRDAYALKASYGQGNAGGAGSGVPGGLSMRRGSVECSVLVLVSRAENLPTVLKWVMSSHSTGLGWWMSMRCPAGHWGGQATARLGLCWCSGAFSSCCAVT
jgi:hypothetical protein